MSSKQTKNLLLFDTLKSRGYDPHPLETSGNDRKVSIEDADLFAFTFIKNGQSYGPARVSIDEDNNLVLYTTERLENSPQSKTKGSSYDDSWTGLQQFLSGWSRRNGFSGFKRVGDQYLRSDMKKRNEMKNKKLSEGYHAIGKKLTYSDSIPSVKILLQHTRQIEEGEQRYRNINRIFVENTNGERFLLPTKRPGIAKVYARHIAEGGTPYDERGKHITSLVEEYTKMAGFVRATKNGQFNESTQRLVNEGINHYQNLRETLSSMISMRGYNKYFDNYTPVLNEESEDSTTLNELFVEETIDPRIESVMPILKRLSKNLSEMSEVKALEEWAETITEVEDETTKTLAEPAADMLDEAPGAETLAHNDNTEEKNLKAFGLAEGFADVEQVADEVMQSMGSASKLTTNDIRDAVIDLQQDMDDPYKLDVEAVVDVVKDRLAQKGMNITDTNEGLDANQKAAGQLGPTEKVGPEGAVGKLVGASESVESDDLNRIKEMIGYK